MGVLPVETYFGSNSAIWYPPLVFEWWNFSLDCIVTAVAPLLLDHRANLDFQEE